MPLFGNKKKQVVTAEEHLDRKVYDYIDVNAYEREREGEAEHVGPYQQRRQVNASAPKKPHWYSLKRKPDDKPSFLESGGDAAEDQADLLER